jgi:pyrroline-5-carboxylate reductase
MRIAFIGGGYMATALIGALRARETEAVTITVAEPVAARRDALAREYGISTTADNAAAARDADTVVIAVKPQDARRAATGIAAALADRRRLVVSIAAGTRLADLRRWLGASAALVRAMPNRPALVGRGMTALCAAPEVTADERVRAERILAASGETLWIESEPLLDVVTAVSGSGPAYFFLLMEALEEAGRAHGLPADIARRLAVVTAAGAGVMAATGNDAPAQLREQVTSPGGTTAAALAVLDAADVRGIFSAAVAAAARRAAELAAQPDER